MSTTEQNKATVRRYYAEIFTKGNLALVDELMTADYVNEDPATPGRCMTGREGLKGLVTMLRGAFEPLKMEVVEQWADGDTVVTKWRGSGNHSAPMFGIAPTGRPGTTEGITISQFRDGKICKDYAVWDAFGIFNQLRA